MFISVDLIFGVAGLADFFCFFYRFPGMLGTRGLQGNCFQKGGQGPGKGGRSWARDIISSILQKATAE